MLHKLYHELAEWYPLLTLLDDYKEEAEYFHDILVKNSSKQHVAMLELGSGAGYNAYFLKQWYEVTLTDLSEKMLDLSRKINPKCGHFLGDMKELRLDRTFDIVFIHDAIGYMKYEEDLRKAIATASVHCKPGGVVLITPDYVKEIFKPHTDHGGEDGDDRSLRYLEWVTGINANGTYTVDFILALRENDSVKTFHDRHEEGLFSESQWLNFLTDAGLTPAAIKDPFGRIIFIGHKSN